MMIGKSWGRSATELAVVILIVGVLLSIFMPMIGKARENSLRARCQSQLRYIASGIGLYLESFDGWLPATGDGVYWFEKIVWHIARNDPKVAPEAIKRFACLKADTSQRGFGPGEVSYGWNEAFVPYRTTEKGAKSPSELILIGDSRPGPQAHIILPSLVPKAAVFDFLSKPPEDGKELAEELRENLARTGKVVMLREPVPALGYAEGRWAMELAEERFGASVVGWGEVEHYAEVWEVKLAIAVKGEVRSFAKKCEGRKQLRAFLAESVNKVKFPSEIGREHVRLDFRHMGKANVIYGDLRVGALSAEEAFYQFPRYWDLR